MPPHNQRRTGSTTPDTVDATSVAITNIIAEHAEAVRGEARYFLVADTPVGVLDVTITRKAGGAKDGRDATAEAYRFTRTAAAYDRGLRFEALTIGLGYYEMQSRDMPVHGDLGPWLERLRADAAKLIARAVAIVAAHDAHELGRAVAPDAVETDEDERP